MDAYTGIYLWPEYDAEHHRALVYAVAGTDEGLITPLCVDWIDFEPEATFDERVGEMHDRIILPALTALRRATGGWPY